MSHSLRFTKYITEKKILSNALFGLVDVGASGGIDPKWLIFYPYIQAVGFDPLVKECERLNEINQYKNIRYVPAFITCSSSKDKSSLDLESSNSVSQSRISSNEAAARIGISSSERYNSFRKVILSSKCITLDDYFSHFRQNLDFLKIDTDGHDIEVLLGARKLFDQHRFLGAKIECQFHGPVHPQSNTFANIDIFMRERGFSLFDMSFYRYSRRDLPGKFLISVPAQTDIGQIMWADVYYFRDLGDEDYSKKWDAQFTDLDIIKLACLYELHNLHDCAIELLNVHHKSLKNLFDVNYAIELLVPPIDGKPARLADYKKRFENSIDLMKFLSFGDLRQNFTKHKAFLHKCHKIILFGAGGRLKTAFLELQKILPPNANIMLSDNDSKKWGTFWGSYQVIPPEQILTFRPQAIIIVSTYAGEIATQLLEMKSKADIDFEIFMY